MSGIHRSAPIIAAALSLAGVGIAALLEPEPLTPCPLVIRHKNNGTVAVPCAPVDKPKSGQP